MPPESLSSILALELAAGLPGQTEKAGFSMPSALDILTADFPEPVWAVPGLFPAGLTFLGGRPKVGKSWMALQLAYSVTAGGIFLGRRVKQGKVLYVALEDSKRRMQERMIAQGWTADAAQYMDVLFLDDFRKRIGFLHTAGSGARLYSIIQQGGYRLVVVDTMSRAFSGLRDLDKAEVVTPALSPLQELALSRNFLLLFVDHHAKPKGMNPNPVDDLMSSTAKSAIADTLAGLYRDQDGTKKLMITGRDVEETSLVLHWDQTTAAYQVTDDPAAGLDLSPNEQKIFRFLKEHGKARQVDIAKATGISQNNITAILKRMVVSEDVFIDPNGFYHVGG